MKKAGQKVYYDKKTDVLWFMVKADPEEEHHEIAPGVNIELGKNDELLGIEILNASKIVGPKLGLKSSTKPHSTISFAHKIKP